MKQLLTTSSIQSFKTCRKRYWFEYVLGLRPEVDAKALRMGGAGHAGLDGIKQTGDPQVATDWVYAYYDRFPIQAGEDNLALEYEKATVAALVSGWFWMWWGPGRLKVIASERSFLFQIRQDQGNSKTATPNYDFAGKIDGLIELEDGRRGVLEHKFLSDDVSPESDLWKRLRLDHQISHYVHGARTQGHDVAFVLYDVIRKPTIRPEKIPILDDQGSKIVLDAQGNRVYVEGDAAVDERGLKIVEDEQGNRVYKPNGEPRETSDAKKGWKLRRSMVPRQSADAEQGYTLQTRPMTPDEWSQKLVEDVAKRPVWYFARVEIARLDAEVDEALDELWDVQKTIRETELSGRWYRTVGRDTCPWCPFFSICHTKIDPQTSMVPEGFTYVTNKHPELEVS